jgi:glucosamine--fructose-6-phosphate aminotransferase (isomerizing)
MPSAEPLRRGLSESSTGELFRAEIREQPQAINRLVEQEQQFEAVSQRLVSFSPDLVRLVGHGSSDNAAAYGVYAFGLLPVWTALRDSISLSIYYGAEPDVTRSAVLALSQSGRTPDVVEYVDRARQRGALTIAVTNEPDSELGQAAELVLPLAAGPEHAVAATKTYVNQLAAVALLAACVAGRRREIVEGLRRVSELMEAWLPTIEASVAAPANAFGFVGRMFVVGRGLEFATAREVALKLTETCRVAAVPFTATDLAHGPIAAVDPLFPVWTIASQDETLPAVLEAAARARTAGAALLASGNAAAEVADASFVLPVPTAPRTLLSPLLSVLPGQLFAAALSRVKGLDPDHPDGLSKVTLAQ